jgi:hypothetical protein
MGRIRDAELGGRRGIAGTDVLLSETFPWELQSFL